MPAGDAKEPGAVPRRRVAARAMDACARFDRARHHRLSREPPPDRRRDDDPGDVREGAAWRPTSSARSASTRRRSRTWVARVRERGTTLPIWIGLPGIVDNAKLLRISMKIGLGESARFLRAHRAWLRRLITRTFTPDPLIRAARAAVRRPARPTSPGFHVYTFNELERTERWRQRTIERLQRHERGRRPAAGLVQRTGRGSSPRCRGSCPTAARTSSQSDQHTTDPEGGAFFMRTEFQLDGLEDEAEGSSAAFAEEVGRAVRDGLADALRVAPQARRDPRLALRPLPGRAAVALAPRRAVRRHPADRLQPRRHGVRGGALRRAASSTSRSRATPSRGRGGAARAARRQRST